ncbi:MAG: toxin-antitoxin system YwqK family antitoxin [Flavobacteriaceae bacterium]
MKRFIIVFFFSIALFSQAQSEKSSPLLEVKGDLILVTFFHDNGVIHQKGTFSIDGALDGLWTSYDFHGNKLSQGNYKNGQKTGQWLFWTEQSLKEVDFVDSKIINVSEWYQKSDLAYHTK